MRSAGRDGIEHLLTQPRSPTTTGKIERFHRSLRAEFLSRPAAFTNLKTAQQALDEWVEYYNTDRPHQAMDMLTPAERFTPGAATPIAAPVAGCDDRSGSGLGQPPGDDQRRGVRVLAAGLPRRHYAGSRCDVHVDGDLLRFFIGDDLVKTAARTSRGEVRNKRAFRTSDQA